jgi:glutamine synthetase
MFLQDGPHDTKVLYIPSVFISYNGDALDEKTVLLRSCQAIKKATLELMELASDHQAEHVHVTLGTEQEFFLVDRTKANLRPDLKMTGRTLFGCAPPKHQQLEDHYFGKIPSKVLAVMAEAEYELWKMGVPVKTRHNEVAPGQFEMAPVFEEASVAVDHNHLTMGVLSTVAHRYGMKVLFHEKPFKGINGSGKHCNWSISTDAGLNLLDPTEKPEDNDLFLLTLTSILLGIHRHGGLLNCAIASANNEHRLGAHEAPPSIISAFLGAELDEVLNSIAEDRKVVARLTQEIKEISLGETKMNLKVAHLPMVKKDTTDRNRTSPMAFTGNKFEFRAVGSSMSPSFPVTVMNTVTAAGMKEILAELHKVKSNKAKPSREEIRSVLKKFILETKRVRFEGNNYSAEWVKEAEMRGLLNNRSAPEAFLQLIEKYNRQLIVDELGIASASELESRFHVLNEAYVKTLVIEAKTLKEVAVQFISPAAFKYCKEIAAGLSVMGTLAIPVKTIETEQLHRLIELSNSLAQLIKDLDGAVEKVESMDDHAQAAMLASQSLKPLLGKIRLALDGIEEGLPDDSYPFPKYSELLF